MAQKHKDNIILGVDPGTNVLGYGILQIHSNNNLEVLSVGVVRLEKYDDHYTKLARIYERIQSILKSYSPSSMAIEAPFYGKNVQSMLKLGRAQGVVMAAAVAQELPVFEYAPKKIKQVITGNGNASKESVAKMLSLTLKMELNTRFNDATDGLATALCHHYQSQNAFAGKSKAKNWSDFVKNNEHKVVSK